MSLSRPVQLTYTRDNTPKHASGYRLGGTLVLTAGHVARATRHRVRATGHKVHCLQEWHPGCRGHDATLAWVS